MCPLFQAANYLPGKTPGKLKIFRGEGG